MTNARGPSPPDLYFEFKKNYGEPLSQTALHVIVLDEFDAIARARGGSGGKGEQGDAGVARDSVVNQLLAKMDGERYKHSHTSFVS